MSTHHGGHLARVIGRCTTVGALQQVVEAHAAQLQPMHLAKVAYKLEELLRSARSLRAGSLRVHAIAHTLEQSAMRQATWLTAWHTGALVRGLTCINYKLQPTTLDCLAAVITADSCARLRAEDGTAWRNIAFGFSMQEYRNALFWRKLSSAAAAQPMHTWRGQAVVSFLRHATMMMRSPPPELVQVASGAIQQQVEWLAPSDVADALYALAKLVHQSNLAPSEHQGPGTQLPGPSSSDSGSSTGSSSSSPSSSSSGGRIGSSSSPSSSRSSSSGGAAEPGAGPMAYPPHLLSALREELVPSLRQQGLAAQGGWSGKHLALFAQSLVHLGAWGGEGTGQQVVDCALRVDAVAPLYALKLLRACSAMSCVTPELFEFLARKVRPSLASTDAELLAKLLSAFEQVQPQEARSDVLLAELAQLASQLASQQSPTGAGQQLASAPGFPL